MNIYLIPKKKAGKLSIIFIITSIVLVVWVIIYNAILNTEITGGFFGNIPMALMTISAFVFSILSFFAGIIALIKQKEHAIIFYMFWAISILFMYFGIAQVIGIITGTN